MLLGLLQLYPDATLASDLFDDSLSLVVSEPSEHLSGSQHVVLHHHILTPYQTTRQTNLSDDSLLLVIGEQGGHHPGCQHVIHQLQEPFLHHMLIAE